MRFTGSRAADVHDVLRIHGKGQVDQLPNQFLIHLRLINNRIPPGHGAPETGPHASDKQ